MTSKTFLPLPPHEAARMSNRSYRRVRALEEYIGLRIHGLFSDDTEPTPHAPLLLCVSALGLMAAAEGRRFLDWRLLFEDEHPDLFDAFRAFNVEKFVSIHADQAPSPREALQRLAKRLTRASSPGCE